MPKKTKQKLKYITAKDSKTDIIKLRSNIGNMIKDLRECFIEKHNKFLDNFPEQKDIFVDGIANCTDIVKVLFTKIIDLYEKQTSLKTLEQ